MPFNLSKNTKITVVANASAAGTSAINSSSVDMTGFEGVMYEITFGAIVSGGVQSINAAQSSDDSTFVDLTGSSVTVADTDDNKAFWLDIHRPVDRYVRLEVAKATQNSTVEGIRAWQYGPGDLPTTHDSTTVGGGELHVSPTEGTA